MKQRAAWVLVLGLGACSGRELAPSGGDAGTAPGTLDPASPTNATGDETTGTERPPRPDGSDSASGPEGSAPSETSTPANPVDSGMADTTEEPSPDEPLALAANEFTRLTRVEYQRTVQAAFGVVPDGSQLPVDGRVGAFTSNVGVTPDPVHPYLLAAEAIAAEVVPGLLPECGPNELSQCLDEFHRGPLEALFRRPLGNSEMSGQEAFMGALFEAGANPTEATRALLAAALVSPDFLFRSSPSSSGEAEVRRLRERLAYALLDAPPDAEAAGAFDAAAEVTALLADPRAIDVLARFIGQWLDVDTDRLLDEESSFADSPDYRELATLVAHALLEEVPITELVSTRRGFVHESNRDAYPELGAPSDADRVSVVDWPADSIRRGLLGQDLFVAATRHPDASRRVIFRGLLVRRSLMCDEIPAPAPELVALAGEIGDRTTDARCSTCHQLLDPIGVAFSALDPDDEVGVQPAVVQGNSDLAGSYDDLASLLERVAASRRFAECFATHFSSFFLEVPLSDVDPAWKARLADAVQAGASFSGLLVELMNELAMQSETSTPWCQGE